MNMQILNKGTNIRNVLSKKTRQRLPPLSGIEKHSSLEVTRKQRKRESRTELRQRIKGK